jgi:hypothetical protein
MPGTTRLVLVEIADTLLIPGQYYLALQSDVTSDKVYVCEEDSTIIAYYYDRAGGYGAFTDPCPTVTAYDEIQVMGVRVKEELPGGQRV